MIRKKVLMCLACIILVFLNNIICFSQDGFLENFYPRPILYPNECNDSIAMKDLKEFIVRNMQYPEVAKEKGISGTVLVNFIVNKKGNIENARIIRGISPECDSEAIRITRLMPHWLPAKQADDPVSVIVNLPIEFSLNHKTPVTIVSGKVTIKSSGLPLGKVYIIIEGTSFGTVSNADGSYRIEIPSGSKNLIFLYAGYAKKVESIDGNTIINVEMEIENYFINFNTQ